MRLNQHLPGLTLEALGFRLPLTLVQEDLLVDETNELILDHNEQIETALRRGE